jgi:putative tryptophan/tyrosine transport system substrate-binding protein
MAAASTRGELEGTLWCTSGEKNRRGEQLGVTVTLWVLLVCLLPGSAGASERGSPVRIGALTVSRGPPPAVVGLIEGLVALGYRENEDFVIGVRFTQGDESVLAAAARQMVREGVDILFCVGDSEAQAAQQATTTHPIVFTAVGDPVGQGLITSYARPGGNITGVTDLNIEVSAKRLQLFKELNPGLKRVLVPYNAESAHQVATVRQYRTVAHRLGIVLVERPLHTIEEARDALALVRKEEIDGILAPPNVDLNIPGFVLETTTRRRIPSMFDSSFFLKHGGLASYGRSYTASGRQAARLVDKIIKGAAPGEIPVEVDQDLEFVVNLKVAKTLGITIPPEVLYQADQILR